MSQNQTPETPTAVLAAAFALLKSDPEAFKAQFPELAAYAPPARPKTANDYLRDVDAALLEYASNLVASLVPEALRPAVSKKLANQLHHLTTPQIGWIGSLPRPDRSEWNVTTAA